MYLPRRLKQVIAVRTLVASHFVSFSVLLFVFKDHKNASKIIISLFLGPTKMSKIKVTEAEIMILCF